ncbi:MAG: GC-type dockerin domain-anchored protein [Phycisphaerales bacterium]
MNRRTLTSAVLALVLSAGLAQAGPDDIGTKYPVGIEVGGQKFDGILDSGGLTSLSFEDAKKAGLLDANGDPVNPPDGSVNVGGTGGGSVKCHVIKTKVKVQPKNADGTNNGDAKEVEVKVVVPKKPADQDGANDAEKQKKTDSMKTKAGANISGATIDGKKVGMKDEPTADPNKNKRSTEWIAAAVQAPVKIPVQQDDNFEDHIFKNFRSQTVLVNGHLATALLSTNPCTMIPMSLAMQWGLPIEGQSLLDPGISLPMYCDSFFDIFMDVPLSLPHTHTQVMLFSVNGQPIPLPPGKTFINPDPMFESIILGSNTVTPEGCTSWFDHETSTLNIIPSDMLCDADVNDDGFVNGDDYDLFASWFESASPQADYNHDGFVNGDDYDAFASDFENGC